LNNDDGKDAPDPQLESLAQELIKSVQTGGGHAAQSMKISYEAYLVLTDLRDMMLHDQTISQQAGILIQSIAWVGSVFPSRTKTALRWRASNASTSSMVACLWRLALAMVWRTIRSRLPHWVGLAYRQGVRSLPSTLMVSMLGSSASPRHG
jgi:hypothetical protein